MSYNIHNKRYSLFIVFKTCFIFSSKCNNSLEHSSTYVQSTVKSLSSDVLSTFEYVFRHNIWIVLDKNTQKYTYKILYYLVNMH